jgi:hypothetical protein
VVLPEGAGEKKDRPRKSRTIFLVLGAFAIAAGSLALGALTSPDPAPLTIPDATPETSTPTTTTTTTTTVPHPRVVEVSTFDVSEIASGPPYDWSLAETIDDFFIHTLVEHEGWLYLFGAESPMWVGDEGGLTAWRSTDGVEWESLGTVIDPKTQVGQVTSTGRGLVAIEPAPVAGRLGIWSSSDGIRWQREEVAAPIASAAAILRGGAVFGDEERLVITASVEFDLSSLLEEHLRASDLTTDLLATGGWSIDNTTDGAVVTVYGPLGIAAYSVPAEELGLTPEEATAAYRGFSDFRQTAVWVSHSDDDWISSEIPGSPWIQSMTETRDGELLAFGFGSRGPTVWRSRDGLNWTESGIVLSPTAARPWGDRLVGPANNRPAVMVSEDGTNWEEVGDLNRHFPAPISWNVFALGAGDAGVAASVRGWARTDMSGPGRPDPPVITQGETTLTLDFFRSELELESEGQTYSWSMHRDGQPGISVDVGDAAVVFSDPDTGAQLAQFSYETLTAAEEEYWLGSFAEERFDAIAVTTDGENWSIEDVEDAFGGNTIPEQIAVYSGRMVVVVGDLPDSLLRAPTSRSYEVWTASIP